MVDEVIKKQNSLKKDLSQLTSYDSEQNNNKIFYLCADVFDQSSWKRLQDRKFNLIFSDASHNPEGLCNEFEMITKFNLLDNNEFIILWDDLESKEMLDAVRKIYKQLQIRYKNKVFLNRLKHEVG